LLKSNRITVTNRTEKAGAVTPEKALDKVTDAWPNRSAGLVSLRDRYRGALIGLAAGDALGTTLEFQPPGTFAPLKPIPRAWSSRQAGIVRGCRLRVDRSDFEEQAAPQTRIAVGDLGGFVEVVRENEPVAADHFL
jgi:hypothetical protein